MPHVITFVLMEISRAALAIYSAKSLAVVYRNGYLSGYYIPFIL